MTFRVSLALALLAAPLVLHAQEKTRFASLEDATRAGAILSGRNGPRSVNWIDGGNRFSYIDRDRSGRETIHLYDPATGRDTVIFGTRALTLPGSQETFAYDAFEWSRDSRHLVFQSNFRPVYRKSGISDFYIYNTADNSLRLATKDARTAQVSPDGTMLGMDRGGNMVVADLAGGTERALTSGATAHRYDGHFDWVYEEEFGLAQAWSWSPDSRHIAFWRTDDHAEPIVQLTDYQGRHPDWEQLAIPQPGDSNATVKIGVSDVKSGKLVWLDPGITGEYYVPRIYWTNRADTLAVLTLNRKQNEMRLFFFDVNTGGRRQVMQESSKTWIDVFDFYAGIQDLMTFPAGLNEFFWVSDRDGFSHVYRYDYSGKLLNQVTRGTWSVTRVEGIDPASRTVYYSSTAVSPLERQLYAVKFDGGGTRRLTTTAGTHHVNLSPNARFYLDRWSSSRQPAQVELWTTAGSKLRTIEDNAATTQWLATHAYSPAVPFRFTTSDSVAIDASMIRPVPFDSTRRYPVILSIYGGPGSQGVYDEWSGNSYNQWLAQQGYIVVDVNNRGTNNYGAAFMKAVYRNLGKWEAHDFAETAKYLATKPWVDGRHMAIMGTSYGGYSTMITMESYPDVFAAGIANSGVADWRLYDSIYTEHYMDLLGDNLDGYKRSSVVENAPKLGGHLLMIHSMMDDNVHPQNTMQLLTAFTNAGRNIDLRIYPPGRHGAVYNAQSQLLMRRTMDEFLAKWLKEDTGAKALNP